MNMKKYSVGSVCSGIEACSVAWNPLGFSVKWLSEIAPFPSKILLKKYPNVPNLGNMERIPALIRQGKIEAPDIICGGTPCQAFSLAGWKKGLDDDRGNLTLKFINIVAENDFSRAKEGKEQTIVFWENVEGVLKDRTNAFGCFIASLAGEDEPFPQTKWPNAGLVRGPLRNVAWRILDAKFFGLPQQRKRLYVLATGKSLNPESILFENFKRHEISGSFSPLIFKKNGHTFQTFREYTDCLYSAYGTKWNGNAAATNGSLFIEQDGRLRRLSPLECERLMGFPDDYTNIEGAKRTQRYQVIGNSWSIPVISWIGTRIANENLASQFFNLEECNRLSAVIKNSKIFFFYSDYVDTGDRVLNCSTMPNKCMTKGLESIVDSNPPEEIFISPVGCYGIIRRKIERGIRINTELEKTLLRISSEMSFSEIEAKSRVQKRGRHSKENDNLTKLNSQISLAF